MDRDFNEFVDDLLVETASSQTGQEIERVNFFDLCEKIHPECPPTWRDMALERINELRLGRFLPYNDAPGQRAFEINASGLSWAASIREARKPLTLWDHLANEKFQKISTLGISILSFLVSIGALIVAYLAFEKA